MTGEIAGTGVLYACGKLKLFEEFVLLANGVRLGIDSNKSTGVSAASWKALKPGVMFSECVRHSFLALIKHAVVSNE